MPGRWRERRRHIGKVGLSNHKSEGLGEQKAGSGQKGACPLMTPRLGGIAGTMPMRQGPILRGLGAAPHFIYACQGQGWVHSPLGAQRSWPEVQAKHMEHQMLSVSPPCHPLDLQATSANFHPKTCPPLCPAPPTQTLIIHAHSRQEAWEMNTSGSSTTRA